MKTSPNSEDEGADEESEDFCPVFREGIRFGELQMEVGMKFNTKWDFKEAVKGCPWVVYALRDHEDTCWQIKTFLNDHTCPREDKNRAANRNWVASKLVKKVRKYPNFKHCDAATYFKSRFDLTLNKNSISRALFDARNAVFGDEKEQYKMLRDYGLTLLKTNPGSTVEICCTPQPESDPVFDKMYVCLSGCKSGFKAGCRPLIGLDGAFLKTQFGGQILSAVGQDANHHIYIIAWAIVGVENKENWKWFLKLLHQDLGDYRQNGWCFISDMQKGLLPAMEEVMPRVHHRFCVWHLWQNFNKQWKDLQLRSLLWECARATTYQEFRDNMNKIKIINEDAWAYLSKWGGEHWTRSQFSHKPKLDSICNNACEVFNSKIKEARVKPIITLLEGVRMFVMRTIAKNKVKLANHVGDTGYEKFEVHGYPANHVVDLGKHLCTCQFWMLTGIPCVHACAALARVNKNPEDFCHKLVTMDSYRETYQHYINPIPGQTFWEVSESLKPQPPKIKRGPGLIWVGMCPRPPEHRSAAATTPFWYTRSPTTILGLRPVSIAC
ncbi:uncharacterized protein LOC130939247 [Arachis stenosperma]|uniref:uncharacterized protein LOC130939247 n=1 Tax=Arachis stenosperma TaxID=217475 RepID=UPI0025AD9B42|nr:uncharacterized protein LOC130939247 [Arachis stenosperma]